MSFSRIIELNKSELQHFDLLVVDSGSPLKEALETIFARNARKPASMFYFSFSGAEDFLEAEALVRGVKKNFPAYLLGNFETPPPPAIVDQAYAAGIDLFHLPLPPAGGEEHLAALDYARTVFPRWGALATLHGEETSPEELQNDIDRLLGGGILPLFCHAQVAGTSGTDRADDLLRNLQAAWRRAGATLTPLVPLLQLILPEAVPPRRRGLGALVEKARDAQLRTSADLRRLLRVREVEQSFESAGL